MPIPLLIDVDTGIDDALGLLHACASDADLVGVTCVAGNVGLANVLRNTRAVMRLGGRGDVPVFAGCESALLRKGEDASHIHGEGGLGGAALPAPEGETDPRHAVDAIIALAKRHAGELVIVATGPLTNLAVAIGCEPALPRLLKRLVLMGGAFAEGGNVTPAAEFNIWADPHAARIVFNAHRGDGAAPLVAIGLDVTRKTRLTPADLDALAQRCAGAPHADAILGFLRDATRDYFELMQKREGARFFTMHDPLAVAAAIDPSLVTTRRVAVEIEVGGDWSAGMTLADWRGVWKSAPNADVAMEVQAERMIAEFLNAMERLARR
jgi:purine nucleosidase